VKRLVQFVKHWAKVRKLSNTRQGGMGSFAWSLMCIYFLITIVQPSVLPNLQNANAAPEYFQGYSVAFSKGDAGSYRSRNEEVWHYSPPFLLYINRQRIGCLITKFFEFVESFDFHQYVISIRTPDISITKNEKGWSNNLVHSIQLVLIGYLLAPRFGALAIRDRRCITHTTLRLKILSRSETTQRELSIKPAYLM